MPRIEPRAELETLLAAVRAEQGAWRLSMSSSARDMRAVQGLREATKAALDAYEAAVRHGPGPDTTRPDDTEPWRRFDDGSLTLYERAGEWQVAVDGAWIYGTYPSEADARAAAANPELERFWRMGCRAALRARLVAGGGDPAPAERPFPPIARPGMGLEPGDQIATLAWRGKVVELHGTLAVRTEDGRLIALRLVDGEPCPVESIP